VRIRARQYPPAPPPPPPGHPPPPASTDARPPPGTHPHAPPPTLAPPPVPLRDLTPSASCTGRPGFVERGHEFHCTGPHNVVRREDTIYEPLTFLSPRPHLHGCDSDKSQNAPYASQEQSVSRPGSFGCLPRRGAGWRQTDGYGPSRPPR